MTLLAHGQEPNICQWSVEVCSVKGDLLCCNERFQMSLVENGGVVPVRIMSSKHSAIERGSNRAYVLETLPSYPHHLSSKFLGLEKSRDTEVSTLPIRIKR